MTSTPSRQVAAVLPALNESKSIESVVKALLPLVDVIVVDDGSTDATAQLARGAGASVVSHERNRGYEAALETGLMHALAQGYRYAVTLDADGQHRGQAVAAFVERLQDGADVVIGTRDRMQRWSERLFAWLARAAWGIRDPLCGMKGYRLSLLERAGRFDTYRSVGTEFSIRAARSGCTIQQVPIATMERVGASRFGGGLRANLRIVRAMWYGWLYARPF